MCRWESAARAELQPSKLGMKPRCENGDRSPVGVVCGIANQLVVERKRRPFVEAVGVVGLKYLLGPVIEPAIADQYAETSGRKVRASLRREPFYYAGHADLVVWASP